MKSSQVSRADTGELLNVWNCGNCGKMWLSPNYAESCCTCIECGEPIGDSDFYGSRGHATHKDCKNAKDEAHRQKRLAEAEKLDRWDGWVFCDGVGSNNGYFPTVEELAESLDWDWEGDWPEYAFVCRSDPVMDSGQMIYDRIIESAMGQGWEDMEPDVLHGCEDFFLACKAFSEANKEVLSYYPDYTRAVRIPRP